MTELQIERESMSTNDVAKIKVAVSSAWETLRRMFEKENRSTLVEEVGHVVDNLGKGVFRLVVMGEIKKGKSSFINALLGAGDLLPTASGVATSSVFKLIYGTEKKLKVFFIADLDTGRTPQPIEISESQVADYGTESGNPNNSKNVDFILIEYPSKLLETGLVIVDTPGVGGLFKAHKDITWKYAPNADAIFFVLDSVESVISEDEVKFLKDLTERITDRVYFVQTKKDIPGVEQWRSWEQRNKKHLLEQLDKFTSENLVYFSVSSKLKKEADKLKVERLARDSGFLEVIDFLQNGLIAEKDMILCRESAKLLDSKLSSMRSEYESRLVVAKTQGKEALDEMERKLQEAKRSFNEWEHIAYQEGVREFSDKFADLKREAGNQLQDDLSPSNIEMLGIIDQFRNSDCTAEQLNNGAKDIQQHFIEICSEKALRLFERFNSQVLQLIDETTKRLGAALDSTALSKEVNSNVMRDFNIPIQESLNMRFRGFEDMRNGLMGMGVGGGVAAIGLNLFALVVCPPAAIVSLIATFAGGYLGVKKAGEMLEEQRKDQALSKLSDVLSRLITQVQRKSVQQFNEIATACERNVRDLFKKAATMAKENLERQLKDIQDRRRQSVEEVQSSINAITPAIKSIDESRSSLLKAFGK